MLMSERWGRRVVLGGHIANFGLKGPIHHTGVVSFQLSPDRRLNK